MICAKCGGSKLKALETRTDNPDARSKAVNYLYRRRQCADCKHIVRTIEADIEQFEKPEHPEIWATAYREQKEALNNIVKIIYRLSAPE